MREDIIEYELEKPFYGDFSYKAYFPVEMNTSEHDKNREMLVKWAQTVAKDVELMGYKDKDPKNWGLATGSFIEKPPELLLWMANYIGDNEEPEWQVVLSSSADGLTPREMRSGYKESLFNLTAKRDYFVNEEERIDGVLSMYLVMHGKVESFTETVFDPIMYTILNVAMGRYAEIATKYVLAYYRDGLDFRRPYACRKGEIVFSLG